MVTSIHIENFASKKKRMGWAKGYEVRKLK
jgi:hypothetical protein